MKRILPNLGHGDDGAAGQPAAHRGAAECGSSAAGYHADRAARLEGVHALVRPAAHAALSRSAVLRDGGLRRAVRVGRVRSHGRGTARAQGQGDRQLERPSGHPGVLRGLPHGVARHHVPGRRWPPRRRSEGVADVQLGRDQRTRWIVLGRRGVVEGTRNAPPDLRHCRLSVRRHLLLAIDQYPAALDLFHVRVNEGSDRVCLEPTVLKQSRADLWVMPARVLPKDQPTDVWPVLDDVAGQLLSSSAEKVDGALHWESIQCFAACDRRNFWRRFGVMQPDLIGDDALLSSACGPAKRLSQSVDPTQFRILERQSDGGMGYRPRSSLAGCRLSSHRLTRTSCIGRRPVVSEVTPRGERLSCEAAPTSARCGSMSGKRSPCSLASRLWWSCGALRVSTAMAAAGRAKKTRDHRRVASARTYVRRCWTHRL